MLMTPAQTTVSHNTNPSIATNHRHVFIIPSSSHAQNARIHPNPKSLAPKSFACGRSVGHPIHALCHEPPHAPRPPSPPPIQLPQAHSALLVAHPFPSGRAAPDQQKAHSPAFLLEALRSPYLKTRRSVRAKRTFQNTPSGMKISQVSNNDSLARCKVVKCPCRPSRPA